MNILKGFKMYNSSIKYEMKEKAKKFTKGFFYSSLLALSTSYVFYNKNKLSCDSDVDSRYGNKSNLENSINQKIEQDAKSKNKNDLDLDLPFDMDDDQLKEIQELLDNPEMDQDTYNELMSQKMNLQPPPFKNFMNNYKCHTDDDLWSGLKISAEYNPMQTFKFDGDLILSPTGKSHKLNLFTLIPSKTNPNQAIVALARINPKCVSSTQVHVNFSKNDRLSLVVNNKQNEQIIYEAEFNKTYDRANAAIKLSNMQSSIAGSVNVFKNLHFGTELSFNPATEEVLYSYAVNCNPHKKLGLSLVYMSHIPMYSFDAVFKVRNYY